MKCSDCNEEIIGHSVGVVREDAETGKTKRFILHPECFLLWIETFRTQIERGEYVDFERKEDMPKSAEVADKPKEKLEDKVKRYKSEAMIDIQKAQEEKDGLLFLCLVNDPASYYAIRQMLSLKGIDMRVEQFEELAAIYIQLVRKAMLKAAQRTAQMPLKETNESK